MSAFSGVVENRRRNRLGTPEYVGSDPMPLAVVGSMARSIWRSRIEFTRNLAQPQSKAWSILDPRLF